MDFFVFVSEQWLLVSTLLLLVYLLTWYEKAKGGKSISVHEATRMMNTDDAVLLDIRESAEYKAGHITNAINIPYNKLSDKLSELEPHKDKVIIMADKMGQHVGSAGRTLREKGFNTRRLEGGMMEWQSQNLPIVKK